MRAEQAKVETRLKEIAAQLEKEHPDYVALVNPEPLTVAQTQALLAPDEAFVQFLDVEANPLSPIPETAFAFVITRSEARWLELPLGARALARPGRGPALRPGLGRLEGASSRCSQLLGKAAPGDDLPPFDLARAHGLYRDLFGQAEDVIKDKRLLIAPSGALTQLPFQVLVTEAPDASAKGAAPTPTPRPAGSARATPSRCCRRRRACACCAWASRDRPAIRFWASAIRCSTAAAATAAPGTSRPARKTAAPQGVKRSVHRAAPPALDDVYRGAVADVEMLRRADAPARDRRRTVRGGS